MRTVELFAGIGGFRMAAESNGLDTVWANDINKNAVKVYQDNYGLDSIIEGDINNLIDKIPEHDILTGGFPCQPFSKAGKKLGIDDYRGTLFETIVKVLSIYKPPHFILENVNSLLFINNGEDFKIILKALLSQGYKIEWKVFNACDFGLPQNRARVIIVGSKNIAFNESYFFNNESIENQDLISHSLKWIYIDDYSKRFHTWGMAYNNKVVTCDIKNKIVCPKKKLKDIICSETDDMFDYTNDTINRIKNSEYVNKFYNGVQILYNQKGGARMGYSIFGIEGLAPTLTASSSRHYERYKIGERFRRLTNIEYARIQGFPDNYSKAVSINNQYKLYGNAVPPQMISYVLKKVIKQEVHSVNNINYH